MSKKLLAVFIHPAPRTNSKKYKAAMLPIMMFYVLWGTLGLFVLIKGIFGISGITFFECIHGAFLLFLYPAIGLLTCLFTLDGTPFKKWVPVLPILIAVFSYSVLRFMEPPKPTSQSHSDITTDFFQLS